MTDPQSLALVFPGCHRRGGVERSVWEAARYFTRRGHDVTLYSRDVDLEGLDGVAWERIPSAGSIGPFNPLAFGRAVAARMATHDVVVSFGVSHLRADVRWVNSVHRAWLEAAVRLEDGPAWRHPRLRLLMPRHLVMLAEERWYFRGSARLDVVVADRVGQDITRLYGVPPRQLVTLHNGFSPDDFSPERSASVRAEQRARFGFRDEDVVAVIAANELPRKGFDVLLRAVAQTGIEHLKVLLVGKASPAAYESLIAELGLAGRVVYGGSLGDMSLAYGAGDVFVLPTKYEAFCLAVVEALASGLPVLTTTVPGAGDLVQDGVNGRLLDNPNDHTDLAKHLIEACDTGTLSRWTAAAAPSVAHLRWETIFAEAERLFAGLGRH